MPRKRCPQLYMRANPLIRSLRQIRRARRVSLQTMSTAINVSANTISAWEIAATKANLDHIIAYADTLGLKLILVPKDKYQERHRDETAT